MNGKKIVISKWVSANWVLFAVIGVMGSWLLNLGLGWLQLWHALNADEAINAGVFGDMFGAVNALFSGLSIIGIIYAIRQQDEQLKLAREEVKTAQETLKIAIEDADKTKEILNDQQLQSRRQIEVLHLQRQESTFFQIISNLIKSEEAISVESTKTMNGIRQSTTLIGKEAIYKLVVPHAQRIFSGEMIKASQSELNNTSDLLYTFFILNNGSYVRILQTAFDVANSLPNSKFYKNILMSNMSVTQIIALGFIGMHEKAPHIKTLIEFNGIFSLFESEINIRDFFLKHYDKCSFSI